MTTETLPLNLLKANAELQLRLTRLLQESSHQWLDSVKEASSQGIAETSAAMCRAVPQASNCPVASRACVKGVLSWLNFASSAAPSHIW